MGFNHYAKIKYILDSEDPGWFVKRINKETSAKNFKGEKIHYSHYYRVCRKDGENIKFCKFQRIDLFAKILGVEVESLQIVN